MSTNYSNPQREARPIVIVAPRSYARPYYWNETTLAIIVVAAVMILLLSACSTAPAATAPATAEGPSTTHAVNPNPQSEVTEQPTAAGPSTTHAVNPNAGETPEPPGTPAGAAEGGSLISVDALVAALEDKGATAQVVGPVDQPFFGNPAVTVKVDGQDVSVFEFGDEATQQAAAATIQANGYIIGTAAVDWMTQPYFFASDNLIAVYVGTDTATVDLLREVMGASLTGPQ